MMSLPPDCRTELNSRQLPATEFTANGHGITRNERGLGRDSVAIRGSFRVFRGKQLSNSVANSRYSTARVNRAESQLTPARRSR